LSFTIRSDDSVRVAVHEFHRVIRVVIAVHLPPKPPPCAGARAFPTRRMGTPLSNSDTGTPSFVCWGGLPTQGTNG